MPKKKARPHLPPPPPLAIQEEEEDLINNLLSQFDSRGNDSEPVQSQQAPLQSTALPKQNARSRFLARQTRKAAALAQASGQEDPAVQARLKRELEQEEGAIQRTCEEFGLEIFNINPDGHCLFSAIADQLTLLGITPTSESNHRVVRRAAADYIQSHADDFTPFLLSGDDNIDVMSPQEFDQYCASIRDTAEWGGEPEIMALSRAYHVPIHVVQSGPPAIVKHDPGYADAGAQDGRTAFISYHRRMYGLGEHYNSLRRKNSSL